MNRGSAIPWIVGTNLFSDICSGRFWVIESNVESGWQVTQIADVP